MIVLPLGKIASATPRFIDRGNVLRPTLGGADQRMDRIGSRWGCEFVTVPMKVDDARIWIARLVRGVREGCQITFPQPGFSYEVDNSLVINGSHGANGEAIALKSTNAALLGKKFKEGQFLSIGSGNAASAYQLHQVTADTTIVSLGAGNYGATVPIQPPLRTSLVNGNIMQIVPPIIQGYVKNDAWQWTVDNAKIYGLSFSIDEII